MEYQIASQFDETHYPASKFTVANYNVPFEDHPISAQLPNNVESINIYQNISFGSVLVPKNHPTKLSHYVGTGLPVLGVHVVTFPNATLVTIYWPHILFDFTGLKDFLKAWQLVMNQKPSAAPQPLSLEADPLQTLGTTPTEDYFYADHEAGTLTYIFGFLFKTIRAAMGRLAVRSVQIPKSFIDAQKQQVEENGQNKENLSDNDIICAWGAQVLARNLKLKNLATVAIHMLHSQKRAISKDILEGSICGTNAIGMIPTIITAEDLKKRNTAYVAQQVRKCVDRARTRQQIEAYAALHRKQIFGRFPAFGDINSVPLLFTNWTTAHLHEIDFGAARVGGNDGPQGGPSVPKPCSPSLVSGDIYWWPIFRSGVFIISSDLNGNYRISGGYREKLWDRIEHDLMSMERCWE